MLLTKLSDEAIWAVTNNDKLVYPEDKFIVIKLKDTVWKMALKIATDYQAALPSVHPLYGDAMILRFCNLQRED